MIKNIISDSINVKESILHDDELIGRVQKVADVVAKCFQEDGKVLLCGNGGSAADAQHIAAELSGKFYLDRPPLPAEAMHVNTSYITAVANDFSYNEIYSRYIQGVGKKGDILIGISTSGNSENIVKAFEAAAKIGVLTIGLTGKSGGAMKKFSDILLNVPSEDTPRIQESQILLGHIVCEIVERKLFG